MNVTSREYKLLVKHTLFKEPAKGIRTLQRELMQTIKTLPDTDVTFKPEKTPQAEPRRQVLFLDTAEHLLRENDLILRQRGTGKTAEYTLKCRSEDRCFVANTSVAGPRKQPLKQKLEEDIAVPFLCRHSHSGTLTPGLARPKNLGEARALFPVLKNLAHYQAKMALTVVNDIVVEERVWDLGKLVFTENQQSASLALILWTQPGTQQPLIAELSFRLPDKLGKKDIQQLFSRKLALDARATFSRLQSLDSAAPKGITKTAFIYGDTSSN